MKDPRLYAKPGASSLLTSISLFLNEEGVRSFLVGGFVRNTILERNTADIDIAVQGDALDTAARVAAVLGGRYFPLDLENGVGRVVLLEPDNSHPRTWWEIDFTTLKGDIENDLAQRDFTIDAMAIELDRVFSESSLSDNRLIDPFHGRDDLHGHLIRAVSDRIFKADAVRLLRAVRMAATFGFTIESGTENLMRSHSHLIASVAGERVRDELLQLLAMPGAGRWLSHLAEIGMLTALIPELALARGVSQPWIHVWDVFDHSMETVIAAEFLLGEGAWEHTGEGVLTTIPWTIGLSRHFDEEISHGSTRRSLLKLAALLHDIAKPQTRTIDDDGRARFLGHPQEGAAMVADILERLRFSTKEIRQVELMVKYHLRPMQMTNEGLPSNRAIYRYFRDTGESGIDILLLCQADHLATRGFTLDMTRWQEHAQIVAYVLKRHFEVESVSARPKLLDGHDLINTFGITPGPRLGKALEMLREAQAAGEVNDRQAALEYVRQILGQPAPVPGKKPPQGER